MSEAIRSLEDLIQRVPAEWVKCQIGISHISDWRPHERIDLIERISFHEDANGRRVLLLHKTKAPQEDAK